MTPAPNVLPILDAESQRLASSVREGILRWIKDVGAESFDPYDFKGTPLVMATFRQGAVGKLLRTALYGTSFLAPNLVRHALGVKPQPTAGGTAHLAQAHLAGGEMEKAAECLHWLASSPSPGEHPGLGWGLPFGWHSVKVVPPNLPIGHTTMTVGNAFNRHFQLTGDPQSLEISLRACEFLTSGLQTSIFDDGSLCLSYTPLDNSQCVNSNIDAAALILRVGASAGRDDLIEIAHRIHRFAVGAQNEDGSWFYMADDRFKGGSIIDGYHTGMVLSALVDMDRQGVSAGDALEKGGRYYLDHLIEPGGWCRFATDRVLPLDCYSVGQALHTLQDLTGCESLSASLRQEAAARIPLVLRRSLRPLVSSSGALWYRRYKLAPLRLKSVRWANALTAWALTRLVRPEVV